jgi:CheY-like chemotaxis protein
MPTTILIAEDEKDIRELIETVLQLDGYAVMTASSGEEVLTKAREVHPDAILLDMSMPRVSGLEVCRQLKADPLCKQVPVAFLSGHNQDIEIRAGLEAGALYFLVKPFSTAQLSQCVRRLLASQEE